MVLTETGLAKVFQRIKSFVASQLNSKASAIHTHTSSDITDLPSGYVVDSALSSSSENPVQNKVVKNALDGKSNTGHTHTKSEITDFSHTHDASEITNLPSGSSQISQIASRTIAPGQAAGSSGNAWSFTCTAGKLIYIKGTFKMSDTGGGISLTSGGDVVISAIGGAPGKVYNTSNLWTYTSESKNVNVYLGTIIYPTSTTITITTYLLGGGSTASFYAYQ